MIKVGVIYEPLQFNFEDKDTRIEVQDRKRQGMRDIHCPKDIGFENTFSGEDCEKEQYYNNCYHCWSTAIAKEKARWIKSVKDNGMSEFKRDPLMTDKATRNIEKVFEDEKCEQFLLKPASGWTRINIPGLDNPDMVLPASYITDVPNDCLDTMINALENNMDFSVSFDAEGWDFKVISDMEDTYVIVSKDAYKVYHSDINKFELGKLLYRDILNYSDAWAMWNPGTDIGDMQLEENRLIKKLNKLKELLNNYDK